MANRMPNTDAAVFICPATPIGRSKVVAISTKRSPVIIREGWVAKLDKNNEAVSNLLGDSFDEVFKDFFK